MASKKQEEADAKRTAEINALLKQEGYEEEGYEAIISGKNIKWEPGTIARGKIITLPYAAGKSAAFDLEIESEEGTETVTYWCPTILKNLLKKCNAGDDVIIKCIQMISTSNGDAYDFVLLKK